MISARSTDGTDRGSIVCVRSLVVVAVAALAGAWLGAVGLAAPYPRAAAVLVLGLALVGGGLLRRAVTRPNRWALGGLALASMIATWAGAPAPEAPRTIGGGVVRVEGVVERVRHGGGRRPRATLRVERGAWIGEDAGELAGARIEAEGMDAPPGTRVLVLGPARPATRFHNPTPHPPWPAIESSQLYLRAREERVLREAPWPARLAYALADRARCGLDATLSAEASGVARALLLGDVDAIDAQARDRVRASGLAHVLAISGLHVAILGGALVALLGWLLGRSRRLAERALPARVAAVCGVGLVMMYASVIDAPSAWRAAVTSSIAWALTAMGRRPEPLAVMAGAVIVLALAMPEDLTRPGMLLSVVATAALLTGARGGSWLREALVTSARTSVATAPIVLWCFGNLPIAGVIANLVAVPLSTIALLPLAALHAALVTVHPSLGVATAPLVESSAGAFLACAELFGEVGTLAPPPPDVAQGAIVTVMALALLVRLRWRWRALILAVCVLALAGAEGALRWREHPHDRLRITFLDVGQGDAALVDLPDGRLMVVDTGGAIARGPDPGARVLVPILRARRRDRVDVLVLSHPHPDHYGGAIELARHFPIDELWSSGQAEAEEEAGPYVRLLAEARARGTRVRTPLELCGRAHRFGSLRLQVRWPCPSFDAGWDANDNSLVLELEHGAHRVWLTGDVEAHAESELARIAPRIDVLKVAHHGSRTSSSEALIARLAPRIAIASAGRANRFGHPHPEVWTRLSARIPCVLATDRDGGVAVESRGQSLRVRTTLGTPGEGCAQTRRGPRGAGLAQQVRL